MSRSDMEVQALVRDAQARVAEATERQRASKPQSASAGVKQGVMSFLGGIGVGGAALVLGPFAGAQGAPKGKKIQGALKGAAGGLAIGISAPVVGAAAGVGNIVEGSKAGKKHRKYDHIAAPSGTTQDEIAANLARDREAYLRERADLYNGLVDDSDAFDDAAKLEQGSASRAEESSGLPPPVDTEYYDVLKISATATSTEIRKAYHRRSLETHPDRNPSNGEEFKNVSDAYQILSDEQKRRQYHLRGKVDSMMEDTVTPEVLFSLMLMPKGFKPIIGDAGHAWVLASEQSDKSKPGAESPAVKEFHEKRVKELADLLVLRTAPFVEGRKEEFTAFAEREAMLLAKEPLGLDVMHTVGYAYSSKAKLILGAQSSVPLRGFFSELADLGGSLKRQIGTAVSMQAMQAEDLQRGANDDVDAADRRQTVTGLSAVFMASLIDIQNVLREVVEVVCTDDEQPADVLLKRAQAINILGTIFSSAQ